MLLENKEAFAE